MTNGSTSHEDGVFREDGTWCAYYGGNLVAVGPGKPIIQAAYDHHASAENAAPCTRHVPGFGPCGLPATDHQLGSLNHPYELAGQSTEPSEPARKASGVSSVPDGVQTVDPTDMTLLAWVGPDEFDSTRGIKSALAPAGWVPLAFKGEHEDRARSRQLRAQLQELANKYNTRIQLVRFHYAEVIETVQPE